MYRLMFYSTGSYNSYQDALESGGIYGVDVTDLSGSSESLNMAGFRTAVEVAAMALKCAGTDDVQVVLVKDGVILDAGPVA